MTTLVLPCTRTEGTTGTLENLDSVPAAALRPEPWAAMFKSVTLLAAEKRHQEGLERFREAVRGLPGASTRTLILRLSTSSDGLLMWAIHLELDRRGVPPCLRWPSNDSTMQTEFIVWLADIHWFAKRHPQHEAQHKGWRDLLMQAPASAKWHAHAYRQYGYAEMHRHQRSLAHWCSQGLALADAHRHELMTLPTKSMQANRRAIQDERFVALEAALLSHAIVHPDRSKEHAPDEVATRRALLFRVHVLAGRAPTKTARYWALLTGQNLTRQAIAKQIKTIEAIAGA